MQPARGPEGREGFAREELGGWRSPSGCRRGSRSLGGRSTMGEAGYWGNTGTGETGTEEQLLGRLPEPSC